MQLKSVLMAAFLIFSASNAVALDISLQQAVDMPVVRLDDLIVRGDAGKIKKFFEQNKLGPGVQVHLTSRGGHTGEAYRIGQLLRDYNAKVSHSYCANACVLVYIGGVTRITFKDVSGSYSRGLLMAAPEDSGQLLANNSPWAKGMLKELQDYCDKMTGSQKFFNVLITTPSSRPHALTSDEALNWGVADRVY